MSAQSINKVTAFLCKIEAAIVQFELIDLSHSPQTHIILHQELFSTTEFYCFGDCLLRFFESISETYPRPLYGLVAVSGVPVDNVVDIPDSEWPEIEGDQLASDFGMIQLRLINSFAAVGRDIYNLPSAYMTRIQDGEESAEGTGIVIGCSEFLSECILRSTRNSDGTPSKQVFPTLGGLKKFSPISETEWAYEQYIMEGNSEIEDKYGYLPLDKAISGDSISRIYDFLCKEDDLDARVLSPGEILERGISKKDVYCEKTLDFFCRLLGTEVSNFALETLPTKGIYLVGSHLSLIKSLLTQNENPFLSGYLGKGSTINQKLAKFPIYLVEKDDLVFEGCLIEMRKMIFGS